jgi:threonine dehydrogenase-like Zn-dependent dehydrogenase
MIQETGLSSDRVKYPFTPGHETVGTIVALGKEVTKWKVDGEIAPEDILVRLTCPRSRRRRMAWRY